MKFTSVEAYQKWVDEKKKVASPRPKKGTKKEAQPTKVKEDK